jgi:hypothetical protein
VILDDDEGVFIRYRLVLVTVVDEERLMLAIERTSLRPIRGALAAVSPKRSRNQGRKGDANHPPAQHWPSHIGLSGAIAGHSSRQDL